MFTILTSDQLLFTQKWIYLSGFPCGLLHPLLCRGVSPAAFPAARQPAGAGTSFPKPLRFCIACFVRPVNFRLLYIPNHLNLPRDRNQKIYFFLPLISIEMRPLRSQATQDGFIVLAARNLLYNDPQSGKLEKSTHTLRLTKGGMHEFLK